MQSRIETHIQLRIQLHLCMKNKLQFHLCYFCMIITLLYYCSFFYKHQLNFIGLILLQMVLNKIKKKIQILPSKNEILDPCHHRIIC